MKTKIAFAGCKDTTFECMRSLIGAGYAVDRLITISPEMGEKHIVSGFMDLQPFAAENNIPVYVADSYSLRSNADMNALAEMTFDILLVIGWQRLIPEWLLNKLSIGAFGMHGSSHALPYGRGRSPMNWSLIQNRELFISNLFKYKPGIDDGDIVDTQDFDITAFDTARTMHYKSTLAMIGLLQKNLPALMANSFNLKKQLDVTPTYYPKRTEEDGLIFWDRDSREIHNLIRAVTRPFPGAFTFLGKEKIRIWSGHPFDSRLFDPFIYAGTILHVFANGDIAVKTGDGSFLITDYEMPEQLAFKPRDRFNHADFVYRNPYNYPE